MALPLLVGLFFLQFPSGRECAARCKSHTLGKTVDLLIPITRTVSTARVLFFINNSFCSCL